MARMREALDRQDDLKYRFGRPAYFSFRTPIEVEIRGYNLLVLERLCSRDEEMDHLALALRQSVQLDHAASFGGTPAAATDVMAKQTFGLIEGYLVQNIDYSGEGTRESPFKPGAHLQFHQVSYELLAQLGVDVADCPRVLDHDVAGRRCDRWQASDRDYWFQIPDVIQAPVR